MITDNILLPLGGLLTCIYIGWVWGPEKLIGEIEAGGVSFKLKKAWVWCIRLLTPVLIAIVTVVGLVQVYYVMIG